MLTKNYIVNTDCPPSDGLKQSLNSPLLAKNLEPFYAGDAINFDVRFVQNNKTYKSIDSSSLIKIAVGSTRKGAYSGTFDLIIDGENNTVDYNVTALELNELTGLPWHGRDGWFYVDTTSSISVNVENLQPEVVGILSQSGSNYTINFSPTPYAYVEVYPNIQSASIYIGVSGSLDLRTKQSYNTGAQSVPVLFEIVQDNVTLLQKETTLKNNIIGSNLSDYESVVLPSFAISDLSDEEQIIAIKENISSSLLAGSNITFNTVGTGVDFKIIISGSAGAGSGDVVGPVSSSNNEVVVFDGVTGKSIKKSNGIFIENGNINSQFSSSLGLQIDGLNFLTSNGNTGELTFVSPHVDASTSFVMGQDDISLVGNFTVNGDNVLFPDGNGSLLTDLNATQLTTGLIPVERIPTNDITVGFQRGTEAEVDGVVVDAGFPAWATNTKRLTVGDGVTAGGVKLNKSSISGSVIQKWSDLPGVNVSINEGSAPDTYDYPASIPLAGDYGIGNLHLSFPEEETGGSFAKIEYKEQAGGSTISSLLIPVPGSGTETLATTIDISTALTSYLPINSATSQSIKVANVNVFESNNNNTKLKSSGSTSIDIDSLNDFILLKAPVANPTASAKITNTSVIFSGSVDSNGTIILPEAWFIHDVDYGDTLSASPGEMDRTFLLPEQSGTIATETFVSSSIAASGGGGFSDPLTTDGDIVARIGGVTTRLPLGSVGGSLVPLPDGSLQWYRNEQLSIIFEDFVRAFSTNSNLNVYTSGGSAGMVLSTESIMDANTFGVGKITCTTSGNYLIVTSAQGNGATGGPARGSQHTVFRTRMRIEDLSDGTDTYTFRIGQRSALDDSDRGSWFKYTHSINSGNWQCVSRDASTTETTNTSTSVVADSWIVLSIIHTEADDVYFYINGTLVATHTANTPTDYYCPIGFSMLKSGASASRIIYFDYVQSISVLPGR